MDLEFAASRQTESLGSAILGAREPGNLPGYVDDIAKTGKVDQP